MFKKSKKGLLAALIMFFGLSTIASIKPEPAAELLTHAATWKAILGAVTLCIGCYKAKQTATAPNTQMDNHGRPVKVNTPLNKALDTIGYLAVGASGVWLIVLGIQDFSTKLSACQALLNQMAERSASQAGQLPVGS